LASSAVAEGTLTEENTIALIALLALGVVALVVVALLVRARSRFRRLPAYASLRQLQEALTQLRATGQRAEGESSRREQALDRAYSSMQAADHRARWNALPIDELTSKGIGKGTVQIFKDSGIHWIGAIPGHYFEFPGIGEHRAMLIEQRLDYLRRCVNDELRTEPKPKLEAKEDREVVCATVDLLMSCRTWTSDGQSLAAQASDLLSALHARTKHLSFWRYLWSASEKYEAALAEATDTVALDNDYLEAKIMGDMLAAELQQQRCPTDLSAIRSTYQERKAEILDLLMARYQRKKLFGGLAESIARRIEATGFRPQLKNVRLRTYQEFGGKFMVCQKRVLLGDEMGLGKTLQAIAFASHLKQSKGKLRGVIVVPASLTENWRREVMRFSHLRPHVLRSSGWRALLRRFIAEGDLVIVTYETTWRGFSEAVQSIHLDLFVADEAHYLKNPEAKRTQASMDIMNRAEHRLLMTGTPIENRLEEMVRLVEAVNVEVGQAVRARGADVDEQITASEFTELVSPAYLRRKTIDVLRELPERIEVEEWVELNGVDLQAYIAAVQARSYPGMRRAVTLGNERAPSAKLQRLDELLVEYKDAGRKVIVFSFFINVLEALQRRLRTQHWISGKVAGPARQQVIDAFSAEPGHGVLLAQITSAGVGLNIQAASVVILMEPQFKPSVEAQAIARSHRMGQTEVVMVHRLLAADTVDVRLWEILHAKKEKIEKFADESRLKAVSPEATKLEESEFAKIVIEEEYQRLKSQFKDGLAAVQPVIA